MRWKLMIRVDILKAKHTFMINGILFWEDAEYFGRLSKTGECYVIKGEDGHWAVMEDYRWAFNRMKVNAFFERKSIVYMNNRKRLNHFNSVYDYFKGNNAKRECFNTFEDAMLYS